MLGGGEVLYVGKAKSLRKRLASYRAHLGKKYSKTSVMLEKVEAVDVILTATEKEALILEASLIKKHRPRYNVILRDDKSYPLIKVSLKDEWPRIVITRKRKRDGNKYFGPFSSISAMHATVQLLWDLFPLRRCKVVRPRSRPCLNYQIKRCTGPCVGYADHGEYMKMVDRAVMILEGRSRDLFTLLEANMLESAEKLDFESAAIYRDQIAALEKTLEKQIVVANHFRDQDVFGIARRDASVAVAVLHIRSGVLNGVDKFFLKEPLGEDEAVLAETVLQYYEAGRGVVPSELLLPFGLEDQVIISERLGELRGGKTSILIPKQGRNIKLMNMAHENACKVFTEQDKGAESWEHLAKLLCETLSLTQVPNRIECYDISNLGGKNPVGSLVVFSRGRKDQANYRHYKIKEQKSPDDYAMMEWVLAKRFSSDSGEKELPNLILIDGGRGQLSKAVHVVENAGLIGKIDLLAIAKDKSGEGEKLFRPGENEPLILQAHSPVLLFLMRVRDETHRFGIEFHRRLRSKAFAISQLDFIPGIGVKRRDLLLSTFGSVSRLLAASKDELSAIVGIGPVLAGTIYEQLHKLE
ncbi:MAG: excinuclease ABC subunit UvrC [Desulfobulbaceae bacterium]|nr:excinuclease ABC subunit UvrC [Desulfobulbaceae bacterium]